MRIERSYLKLSTPFWEFLYYNVFKRPVTTRVRNLSTPFWEFHIKSSS